MRDKEIENNTEAYEYIKSLSEQTHENTQSAEKYGKLLVSLPRNWNVQLIYAGNSFIKSQSNKKQFTRTDEDRQIGESVLIDDNQFVYLFKDPSIISANFDISTPAYSWFRAIFAAVTGIVASIILGVLGGELWSKINKSSRA